MFASKPKVLHKPYPLVIYVSSQRQVDGFFLKGKLTAFSSLVGCSGRAIEKLNLLRSCVSSQHLRLHAYTAQGAYLDENLVKLHQRYRLAQTLVFAVVKDKVHSASHMSKFLCACLCPTFRSE
jgi:hypothetical protein